MVTLPSEHVRGRYTLGMYQQMGYTELITYHIDDYINLTKRLLTDSIYQKKQVENVNYYYQYHLHQNSMVAEEWLSFIAKHFWNG